MLRSRIMRLHIGSRYARQPHNHFALDLCGVAGFYASRSRDQHGAPQVQHRVSRFGAPKDEVTLSRNRTLIMACFFAPSCAALAALTPVAAQAGRDRHTADAASPGTVDPELVRYASRGGNSVLAAFASDSSRPTSGTRRVERSATPRQTGIASWYGGPRWQGNRTSSGERYNENRLTAAHASLPLGSLVRVTLVDTEQSVVVTITDRPGTRRRVIDLSRGAASALGMIDRGVAEVSLQPL